MIRMSSPTRNSAGQTRLPTFSMISRSISSSGSAGSAERTMFASRWHSPPKPLPVLSWTTGTCRLGEPVGVEAALHVALQHAGAHARPASRARARAASSCRRRARSSGSRRRRRRGRSRRGWRARSCCWRPARPRRPGPSRGACGLLLDLDGLHLELVAGGDAAPRRRRTWGSGRSACRSPTRARTARTPAGPRSRSRSSAEPSQTRVARDDVPVERPASPGTTWRRCADAQLDLGHAPPRRVAQHRLEHRAGDRQLVHPSAPVRRVGLQLGDLLQHDLDRPLDHAPRPRRMSPTLRSSIGPGSHATTTTLPEKPPTALTNRSTVCGSIPCGLIISPSSIGRA